MFERFTEKARRALFYARARTVERDGDAISCEDLLDGLLLSAPNAVMRFASSTAEAPLSVETEEEFMRRCEGDDALRRRGAKEIPFSDAAKLALNRAIQEANDLGHKDVRPEHLLLGVLRDDKSEAWRRLHAAGVRLGTVRQLLADASRSG